MSNDELLRVIGRLYIDNLLLRAQLDHLKPERATTEGLDYYGFVQRYGERG